MQVGWIADEVEALFPALVTTDPAGFRGVAYARAVAVLAQALRELTRRYDDRISAMEDKLAALTEAMVEHCNCDYKNVKQQN